MDDKPGEMPKNQKRPNKIIQPLTPPEVDQRQSSHPATNRPNINPSEIYPDAVREVPTLSRNRTPDQSLAIATSQAQSAESNKLIFMRVKSVLIIGIILALSSLTVIALSTGQPYGNITAIFGFIQLAITASLFLSRDKHTVSLILKIFLVLQIVGLFMSLANPISLVINLVMVVVLGYAYLRVKSLSY